MPKRDSASNSELQTVFKRLAETLLQRENLGETVISCSACGFRAAIEDQGFAPLKFCRCLVCAHKARYVPMACSCGHISPYDGGDGTACGLCEKPFDYDEVVRQHHPKTNSVKASRRHRGAQAKCHVCRKGADTVFHFDEQWLCLHCLEEHRSPGTCEVCHTVQTGDLEGSFDEGCMECSGRISWD